MQLRPYQTDAVNAVFHHLEQRKDNPVVVIPTGGGKTPVMATICRQVAGDWSGRVLILSHVKELLEQSVQKLSVICPEIRCGVYSASLKRRQTNQSVIVAGIQSVFKRACDLGAFDLILVDEAHLIPPDGDGMYLQFLSDMLVINPQVRIVGLTATPYRLRTGLIFGENYFLNAICYEIGVRELIRDNYLSPLISKAAETEIEVEDIHIRGGEFIPAEVESRMDQDELVLSACREIVQKTYGRRSVLIFASGVQHGRHVQATLQEVGHQCGFVCGETDTGERTRTLKDFVEGRLKFLANVNVLTTGFDAPSIDCVAMLRPTLSKGLYYQMVGRGFRKADGKADCLVLDFGGNILRHGPIDAMKAVERSSRSSNEPPAKKCPQCRSVIAAGFHKCPDCGFEFPPPEKKKHDQQATTAGILSTNFTDEAWEVRDIYYSVHTKKDAAEDDPKTMRVEYLIGMYKTVSDFVCVEHEGYARMKAEMWWDLRSHDPMPSTAAEAVERAESGCLAVPESIVLRTTPCQKYPKIVQYELGPKPEKLEDLVSTEGMEEAPF